MKIYKGDAGFELTVQAFLDLLEEDALDDLVNTVIDMDMMGDLHGDFDGDVVFMGTVNMEDLNGDDWKELLGDLIGDIDDYEVIQADDFQQMFGGTGTAAGQKRLSNTDNLPLSEEDLRVKRIVERFRHVDDAS